MALSAIRRKDSISTGAVDVYPSSAKPEWRRGICNWIRREMLTGEGRIEGPYRVFDDAYAYRNATLIAGAHLARQYDLSHGLMPDLLSWHDPVSGGFHNDRTADGGMSDRMDVPYACGPGLACQTTGRLDVARSIYRFLRRIYSAQTEMPDRFYYAWSCEAGGTIKEFPENEAFWHVVENRVDRPQRWTVGGIAAGFLCRLYLADPRAEYLALAPEVPGFFDGGDGCAVQVRAGLQEQLGKFAPVSTHWRTGIPGLVNSHGRLVHCRPSGAMGAGAGRVT